MGHMYAPVRFRPAPPIITAFAARTSGYPRHFNWLDFPKSPRPNRKLNLGAFVQRRRDAVGGHIGGYADPLPQIILPRYALGIHDGYEPRLDGIGFPVELQRMERECQVAPFRLVNRPFQRGSQHCPIRPHHKRRDRIARLAGSRAHGARQLHPNKAVLRCDGATALRGVRAKGARRPKRGDEGKYNGFYS
jgi:hypothetical protein